MTLVYKPAEVMKMLDLKESTYKKYILELERAGYVVQKDGRTRLFTDDDIQTLNQFMELLRYDGVTIRLASEKIAEMKGKKGKEVMTDEPENTDVITLVEMAVSNALEKQGNTFAKILEEQQEFNKQLLERLDNQDRYIKDSLERRDRQLLESFRAMQEAKTEQKKAELELAVAEEKAGFWGRLFGKK